MRIKGGNFLRCSTIAFFAFSKFSPSSCRSNHAGLDESNDEQQNIYFSNVLNSPSHFYICSLSSVFMDIVFVEVWSIC